MRILPFQGLYYNIQKIGDFNKVLSPPYDLIRDGEIEYYRRKSQYNMINLILRKPANCREYAKAKRLLSHWIKSHILLEDRRPAFYLYNIRYRDNSWKSLKGFLGLLDISSLKGIYDHERVYPQPRDDRFRLLKAVRTNLSPIYLVSFNKENTISELFDNFFDKNKVLTRGEDNFSCQHLIQRVEFNKRIERSFLSVSHEEFLIADGHHRFSASIKFRHFLIKKYGSLSRDHPANFVFCFFSDIYQQGLRLGTFYRLLKIRLSEERIKRHLSPFFSIEKVENIDKIIELVNSLKEGLLLGFTYKENSYILKLRSPEAIENLYPQKLKPLLKVGVFILHDFIFRRVLKIRLKGEDLEYTPSWDYFKSRRFKFVGFIPPVVSKDCIKEMVERGLLFPHKSTYFFPKVLTGLIIRKPF